MSKELTQYKKLTDKMNKVRFPSFYLWKELVDKDKRMAIAIQHEEDMFDAWEQEADRIYRGLNEKEHAEAFAYYKANPRSYLGVSVKEWKQGEQPVYPSQVA